MSADSRSRRTPLADLHVEAGARMVEFAGWSMPVQYSGVIHEHLAVRRQAGLFDVSHMGEARVSGAQALDLLQYATCNDVSKLRPGRAQYNGLMNAQGGFVDDLLVYMLDDREYLLVLNAANTQADLAWLSERARAYDASVEDVSSDWALIAVQGPNASPLVQELSGADLAAVRYYRFVRADVAGVPCLVSRTGYTGEDGFELYAPPDGACKLWRELRERGGSHGLVPAGLGARDTLRLEARMALYGNDIDATTTPLEADLGWIVKPDKGEFVGRDVLLRQAESGVSRKLVGFEMQARSIARHGYEAMSAGETVGRVTSGSYAPFLEKNIGLAYLPPRLSEPGTSFEVVVRNRREPAVVVATPFYKRPR